MARKVALFLHVGQPPSVEKLELDTDQGTVSSILVGSILRQILDDQYWAAVVEIEADNFAGRENGLTVVEPLVEKVDTLAE
jgi:hypothetical protein